MEPPSDNKDLKSICLTLKQLNDSDLRFIKRIAEGLVEKRRESGSGRTGPPPDLQI